MIIAQIRKYVYFWVLIFITSYILSNTFQFSFLPNIGSWLQPVTEYFANLFIDIPNQVIYSDSLAMFVWVALLILLSGLLALPLFFGLRDQITTLWIRLQVRRIATYYLLLLLLIYGFNKVFNYQFQFPEPNILFTPMGQLSPDILYWSTMGTSQSYSIFAGTIEVIAALFLIFNRTRLLGGLIAFGVLLNVLMINVGFGITVITQTCFLLLLCILIIAPHVEKLKSFFLLNDSGYRMNEFDQIIVAPRNQPHLILKGLFVLLLLAESLFPYFRTRHFNGHNVPAPDYVGAYHVSSNPEGIKHFFFHSHHYFIIQTEEDHFYDYKMNLSNQQLILHDYFDQVSNLTLTYPTTDHIQLTGDFFGILIDWTGQKQDLHQLPIMKSIKI